MISITRQPHNLTEPAVAYRLGTGPGSASSLNSTSAKSSYPNLKTISIMLKWFDWETAAGTFSSSVETSLRNAFADAATNNYGIILRFVAGADAPTWLYDDPYRVKRFRLFNDEGTSPVTVEVPVPDDSNYITRYNLALDRLAGILRERIGTTDEYVWQRCVMVPVAGPTSIGSEMAIGYSNACGDTDATTSTLSADFDRDASTLSLSSDPGSWPSGATQFLVRLGSSTNESSDRLTYPLIAVEDTFESRTVSSGFGYNRDNLPWSIAVTQSGGETGSSADFSVGSGVATITLPPRVAATSRRYAWLPFYSTADCELNVRFRLNTLPTLNQTDFGVMVRATDQTTGYLVAVRRNVGNTNLLAIQRNASTDTTVGSSVSTTNVTASNWWHLRVRVEASGSDVRIRAKAWQDGTTPPSSWELDVTDSSGTKITAAGYMGLTARQNSDNQVSWDCDWLKAGAILTGPVLLKVTRSTTTLTVVERDWSGSLTLDQASGTTVRYVTDSDLSSGTVDSVSGPYNTYIQNQAWGERVIQGEVNRRDRYRDAWARCIHEHMARLPYQVKQSVAGSNLWSDGYARADQLAAWMGDASSTLPALGGESGSAAFSGALPRGNYGRRLIAMTTNIDENDDWDASGGLGVEPDFYSKAAAAGCAIGTQTAGTGVTASGQDLVTAVENFLEQYPLPAFMETGSTRFSDAATTTGNYKGWTGGSGRTMRQYLIDDASASVQDRV